MGTIATRLNLNNGSILCSAMLVYNTPWKKICVRLKVQIIFFLELNLKTRKLMHTPYS